MQAKTVNLEDAVGRILSHDLTKIVRGKFKGPAFRKGHLICREDIEELLKMGKENVYVLELAEDELHEDDAGIRLGAAAAGAGIKCCQPKESRVSLFAEYAGLLKINLAVLEAVNDLPEVVLSTLPNNTPVIKGEMVAGTKVIPLAVKEDIIISAEKICRESGGILRIAPYQKLKAAVIVTGSEVYSGRIKDEFGPVLKEKIESFGSTVDEIEYAPDNAQEISRLINGAIDRGAEIVLVSGGMSVDPDDVTPLGIRLSGAVIEKYGAPVLPGAMFLLAYKKDAAVLGVPACGMFFRTTVLDIVLPRLFTKEKVKKYDLVALAHGGLCRSCPECRYPRCSFGLAGSGFQLA
ncbi:MAG: Molybdenum cofactor cytidylyltransferase [Desulfotomaculum sp. 46_296]|nr:MAG: Molybdenum cofactor cytidylyltransferase [Desulfotomaculum sp. 46_296]HAU32492.1 molybdopterin-binding protein [Desulfotomaculum sp.]